MTKPTVSLDIAWRWCCPSCKAINYVGSTLIDPGVIAKEDVPEGFGDADLVTQPENVICNKCRNIFKTEEAV